MRAVYKVGNHKYFVTVRYGVAEITKDKPLPDMPEPIGQLECDETTWRDLALNLANPASLLASGKLSITGDQLGFIKFTKRFQTGA